MGTLFEAIARAARRSAPAGTSTVRAALRVDAAGPQLERERAPLALALVIDVSGSMAGDSLAHVLRSCELVADLLDARDRLAIITFGGHAGVRCGLTVMDDAGRTSVRAALRDVTANGSTNLHAGLEAGAGVLMAMAGGGGGGPAPRRAMVVMSDGVPNIGLSSPTQLAGLVGTLGVATSALGFGLHHDDAVLDAIATAGSGRYAYVPDPLLARVDLARAALAHAGVVADHLEVAVELAAGVELARVVPATPLRVAAGGVKLALGDVFVDEGRLVAFELALDLRAGATGKLATVSVTGTAPDGTRHTETAALAIDIHAGPHVTDRDAERDVELVRAEAARAEARAHVDRGAAPAAVTLLREAIARIEACDGFVAGDGSLLSELREQLIDEIANYERRATAAEASHQRKGGRAYKAHIASQRARVTSPVAARLVGISDPICGLTFELFADTTVGRSSDNDVTIPHDSLSRRHSRFVYVDGAFRVQDFGSTNGTRVNGHHVESCALADRDEVAIGNVVVRFELGPT